MSPYDVHFVYALFSVVALLPEILSPQSVHAPSFAVPWLPWPLVCLFYMHILSPFSLLESQLPFVKDCLLEDMIACFVEFFGVR